MPEPSLPLRDLHLPDPVGWWPPAPGWWVLAVLLLLLPLAGWALRRQLRRRPPRYRRAALVELERIRTDFAADGDDAKAIGAVSALLKRVALQCFPAEQVAPLSGAQWADFLGRDSSPALQQQLGLLLERVHRPGGAADIDPLLEFAARWIRARERL